jgi:hypothetical protein
MLQHEWLAVGEVWNDATQRQFEREYWSEFERVIPRALEEVYRLEELLSRAKDNMP